VRIPFHLTFVAYALALTGCGQQINDPQLATEPYPLDRHTTNTVDIQVFRDGTKLEIINASAHSFSNFDLWINQRYVRHVDALRAGESITLSLWDFHDEFGDTFSAGGFFRAFDPMPVRMVEIQPAAGHDMLGLIAIRAEEVRVKPEPGRE
jgi:hypothetical protein